MTLNGHGSRISPTISATMLSDARISFPRMREIRERMTWRRRSALALRMTSRQYRGLALHQAAERVEPHGGRARQHIQEALDETERVLLHDGMVQQEPDRDALVDLAQQVAQHLVTRPHLLAELPAVEVDGDRDLAEAVAGGLDVPPGPRQHAESQLIERLQRDLGAAVPGRREHRMEPLGERPFEDRLAASDVLELLGERTIGAELGLGAVQLVVEVHPPVLVE